jgi:hypothetical protein
MTRAMPVLLGASVLGASVLVAVVLPAAASAGPQSTSRTRVISSCTKATYEPHSYVLTCGDGNIAIRKATYSRWGAASASGRGTYVYNTCTPSCAAGTFKHHPVTFTLGRARMVDGQKLFTRMTIFYAGLSETFTMPTRTV